MRKVVLSLIRVLAFWCGAFPIVSAAESTYSFANGLEVRVLEGLDETRFAVRLDTGVGVTDESTDQGGEAAAFLATLLHAATPTLGVGKWVQVVSDSGMTLSPHLEAYSTGLTLAGETPLLERGLWLLGDRLTFFEVNEADVRKIRPAVFFGAEADKYRAISSRGDEVATLRHMVLGNRLGRGTFESRLRASRLSSNVFREMALGFRRKTHMRITLVIPTSAYNRRTALVESYLGALDPWSTRTPKGEESPRASVPEITETVRGRFDNPRDSTSVVGFGWNLSHFTNDTGWSSRRAETVAEVLTTMLSHPGGWFQQAISKPESNIIEARAVLTGTKDLVLILTATCRAGRFGEAKAAIQNSLRELLNNRIETSRVRSFAKSRAHALSALTASSESRASIAATLWTNKRLANDENVTDWLSTFFHSLRNVEEDDLKPLLSHLITSKRRVEARFVPERSIRSQEIGLTEEIMATYVRIITDSRCPRPGAKKMKWTEILKRKYGMNAETYVRLSQKITARARLMRRISNAADQRCEGYERLREIRSYSDIARIHQAVSCGPGGTADFKERQVELKRVFRSFDLDPSLYRPLVAMAREDLRASAVLRDIERRCKSSYGPGANH
jgi:hypothetical protein